MKKQNSIVLFAVAILVSISTFAVVTLPNCKGKSCLGGDYKCCIDKEGSTWYKQGGEL